MCLGLKNKKEMLKNIILELELDIICLQEVELETSFQSNLLSFQGFNLEVEQNTIKARTAIYIKDSIPFVRRTDLEGLDSHIVIIDVMGESKHRLINLYRCFNPQDGSTAREKFMYQLDIVRNAFTKDTFILGDFNLDDNMKFNQSYQNKELYNDLDRMWGNFHLTQVVKFATWSRVINNILKSSILDHVYCADPTVITGLQAMTPPFGDHQLIWFEIEYDQKLPTIMLRRDWRKYTKHNLLSNLEKVKWQLDIEDVQSYWNVFEQELITVVDSVAPLATFSNNNIKNPDLPRAIISKQYYRKRLLKKLKVTPTNGI